MSAVHRAVAASLCVDLYEMIAMDAAAPCPRVLVAEDNAVNQRVALRMLAKLGYDAEAVENGFLAIEATARGAYDLVLMDCQMPELDGYEATARIRTDEDAGRHLPIVAMTANALPGDRARCLAAGMDDYLPKPVTLDALAAVVARWAPRQHHRAVEEQVSPTVPAPVADAAALAQLGDPAAGGDPEFLAEVVGIFLGETPGRLELLRDGLARGDGDALARTAHMLRSSCGSLGLRRMQALCGEIEAYGRQGATGAAAPLLARLRDELGAGEAALNEAIRRAG